MVQEFMLEAEKALIDALDAYESNGVRYEPADREELQNLIVQVEKLRQRLNDYMVNLPDMDHHSFGNTVRINLPRSVAELFEGLEKSQFISPEGPLKHSVSYQQLKELFPDLPLSIAEAYFLLRKERIN